jgi:hypothetical protein
MYTSPVRGEKEDGCQSLAPGDAGQMSRVTSPSRGCLDCTYFSSPVVRSTFVDVVMCTNGFAYNTSPVARSIR